MNYGITVIRLLFLLLFIFLMSQGKMMLWFALFALSLVAAIFLGRIYCGYVCPMNTLMVPTQWLAKRLKLQTKSTPQGLKSEKFPWIALVGSVAIMLLVKRLFKINIPILFVWLVISIIITLRYKPSVFHNLICPWGALQKVFGNFAIYSTRVDKQSCIGCKFCERICPSEAIKVYADKKAKIDSRLCLQCSNCQQVCPKNSIHLGKVAKVEKTIVL